MEYSDTTQFKKILSSLSHDESELLNKAYAFAEKTHEWQKRKSWEDYFIHPLSVWLSLWKRFWDLDLLIAWLLHDTVEDCESLEMETVYKEFWDNVWFIVDSITKTEKTFLNSQEEFKDERDKMLSWWMKNIWCILVKLADREHNLATLKHMPAHKQVKKSFESQSLYIPLMHILWFNEEWTSLEKCEWLFKKYVEENELKVFKDIKLRLLNVCFTDFNEELFDVVYNNTSNVVWEINDKSLFKDSLARTFFDSDNIELISLKWDANWLFAAIFKIYWGDSYSNLKWMKLSKTIF